MTRSFRRAAMAAVVFLLASFDLPASDHLMVIQEVFPGTHANPGAQYVMLRLHSANNHLVANDFVEVQDATGVVLGRFGTFTANAGTGGTAGCAYPNCPAIIMGTSAAQTMLGFNFDVVIDAQAGRVALPLAGGRVCFRIGTTATSIPDCVAYGNFTGANTIATPTASGCDANFGTPAAALSRGFALTRKQFNCVAKENSADFENRFPRPVSNNGGNANTDSDADGLINVLDCDDTGAGGLYPPIGVAELSVTGGLVSNWSWTPEPATAGSSLVYDLTQMLHTHLTGQPTCNAAGVAGVVVTGAGVTGTGAQESFEPAPDEIFYYVVRSRTTCGAAPYC